jgi:hypothetical protein
VCLTINKWIGTIVSASNSHRCWILNSKWCQNTLGIHQSTSHGEAVCKDSSPVCSVHTELRRSFPLAAQEWQMLILHMSRQRHCPDPNCTAGGQSATTVVYASPGTKAHGCEEARPTTTTAHSPGSICASKGLRRRWSTNDDAVGQSRLWTTQIVGSTVFPSSVANCGRKPHLVTCASTRQRMRRHV